MAEKKTYLIVQSVLCVLLCVLLAASAVSIYREGAAHRAEDPMASIYTREKTAEKFKPIAPLFFGAIGMTVAGWILAVKDENADKPVMDAEIVRNLTVSRVKTPSEAMLEEQKKQKQLALTGWGLFALCMVPIAIYVLNGKHFPDGNLEEMIAALAIHVFPWIILGLGCLSISSILQEKSIQRETAAAQEQLKAEKAPADKPKAATADAEAANSKAAVKTAPADAPEADSRPEAAEVKTDSKPEAAEVKTDSKPEAAGAEPGRQQAGKESGSPCEENGRQTQAAADRGHRGGGLHHPGCHKRQRKGRVHQSRKYLYGVCGPWIM